MSQMHRWGAASLALALAAGACTREDDQLDVQIDSSSQVDTLVVVDERAQGPYGSMTSPMSQGLWLEVDLEARELRVHEGSNLTETHPVAVGSPEWPTRTGEFTITEVVWNPSWTPPDEEWAKDEEPREPGDPENPLGRAQLVYDRPATIHGTNEPSSLGQAVSHGSIRLSNEVVTELARRAMAAGGAERDDAFFREVRENRDREQVVRLSNPVPIRIVERSAGHDMHPQMQHGAPGSTAPGSGAPGQMTPGAPGSTTPGQPGSAAPGSAAPQTPPRPR